MMARWPKPPLAEYQHLTLADALDRTGEAVTTVATDSGLLTIQATHLRHIGDFYQLRWYWSNSAGESTVDNPQGPDPLFIEGRTNLRGAVDVFSYAISESFGWEALLPDC